MHTQKQSRRPYRNQFHSCCETCWFIFKKGNRATERSQQSSPREGKLCPHERFNNMLLISDFSEQHGNCIELIFFFPQSPFAERPKQSILVYVTFFHKQTTARKTYIIQTVACLSDLIRPRQHTVLCSYLFLSQSHWSSEGQQNYKWQSWRYPRKLSDQPITGRCFTRRAPAPR